MKNNLWKWLLIPRYVEIFCFNAREQMIIEFSAFNLIKYELKEEE